jgi:hypothetical protein
LLFLLLLLLLLVVVFFCLLLLLLLVVVVVFVVVVVVVFVVVVVAVVVVVLLLLLLLLCCCYCLVRLLLVVVVSLVSLCIALVMFPSVLSCLGLWDVFSNQAAVDYVHSKLRLYPDQGLKVTTLLAEEAIRLGIGSGESFFSSSSFF